MLPPFWGVFATAKIDYVILSPTPPSLDQTCNNAEARALLADLIETMSRREGNAHVNQQPRFTTGVSAKHGTQYYLYTIITIIINNSKPRMMQTI